MFSISRRLGALIVATVWFALPSAAWAQEHTGSADPVLGVDPYNPTQAAWLRNYGAVFLSSESLTNLDPYNPTHAALIRQLNGALPLWAVKSLVVGIDSVSDNTPPQADASGTLAERSVPVRATEMLTIARPTSNDGIWIRFGGRVWISDGRAVPLQAAGFNQIGVYAGHAVYQRSDAGNRVIYVPTRTGFVAPFREKL